MRPSRECGRESGPTMNCALTCSRMVAASLSGDAMMGCLAQRSPYGSHLIAHNDTEYHISTAQ